MIGKNILLIKKTVRQKIQHGTYSGPIQNKPYTRMRIEYQYSKKNHATMYKSRKSLISVIDFLIALPDFLHNLPRFPH